MSCNNIVLFARYLRDKSTNMIDELTDEVQQLFPHERHITPSLLTALYTSAKLNHAKQLVAKMNDIQNVQLRDYLLNMKFDEIDGQSITPLTMAATAGNLMYAKTLLSKYHVDMECECNVIFDGLVVYGATALWVAAGLGHLQVVKLLVQSGADVNHSTKAQSSPLRAACYSGRLDIVKYLIEHGANVNLGNKYHNTCIMIASYKGHTHVVDTLLKNGANPNEQALCGATALHYAAECGHLDVCRILLDHGARLLRNECGLTPVLNAAERTHTDVVEMFINRPALMEKEDIIIALELIGASFANDKDNYSVQKAYDNLMRAMELRFSDSENIIRKRLSTPVPAYDNWNETENIPELRAIRLNHHSIHMESLTIRERILGTRNPDLPQPIVYRGAVMADQGRFSQCQILWNYAMDLRIMNNVPVERDLLRFAQLFSQMMRMENTHLEFSHVLAVLVKCQQEIERSRQRLQYLGPSEVSQDQTEQNLATALYLIKIVTKLLGQQSVVDKELLNILYVTIKRLIQLDTRIADGQSLLHMAVNGVTPVDEFYTSEICKFPCYRTCLVLIHAGASVSATDNHRNTPLHTIVSTLPRESSSLHAVAEKIVKLLIDAGAHLDVVNEHGMTPVELCHIGVLNNLLLSHANSAISLKCIASRCIAVNKIKYRGIVPTSLESYIQLHSTEKINVQIE